MNINDGQMHKVLFSKGKLYLDGEQIAGEGIIPEKDILFQFKTNIVNRDSSVLEVNVHDKMVMQSVGPGQLGKRKI